MLETILAGAVRGGTSILYATLGETVAERAGVINLGTEGCMLAGALGGYAVSVSSGNLWLGVAGGAICGLFLAMVLGIVALLRGGNQLATGLVVTFLALGLTSLFGQSYVARGIDGFEPVAIPGLSRLPLFGSVLFEHDPLTYASFFAVPLLWWILRHTPWGLALRAAGERDEVLAVHGRSPTKTKFVALAAGGALAGLGGAQLSTAFTHTWAEGMTAGRGYVAVALVIFAAWDPLKAVLGAYLFSGAIALQLQLQAEGWELSPFLLNAVPYLVTLIALAVLGRRRVDVAPEGLQKVFQ